MGLITEEVEVAINPSNKKYYTDLGYKMPKTKGFHGHMITPRGTIIIVNVNDLPNGSHANIDIKCDGCGEILKDIIWQNYKKYVKEDDKYYCYNCAIKQDSRIDSRIKTILNNGGISFEQWCINNNRQDVLDRWDYELNNCNPNEILYASSKKYYFKCPRGIHESELKIISAFTNGQEGSICCNKCSSFAQWGINNLGDDFLNKYWDYKKNIVDPWMISYGTKKSFFIKCQDKDYHETYPTTGYRFTAMNQRCPYCSSSRIHPMDSLGKLLEDKGLLHLWSDKNKQSPWEYAPHSNLKFWWKCFDGIHKDYKRNANDANKYHFRCPECNNYSKGETRIANYFVNLGLMKIDEDDYKILDDIFKEKYNYYIPQKEFDGLIGLRGGNLSYDFYLPKFNLNLLIEYQGIQHEKYIPGFHKSKKDFNNQQEHDRRKREYAKINNINLLEIWYWDYDNIEHILNDYFNVIFQ